ncbi:MAG: DUF308 domain-containing protein [Oscillospiraceae bacterium]|nr:DUF308 domain-containing protein [Oscillospiraceae bacterium]
MDYRKIERFLMDTGKYLWVLLCGLVLTFNPEGATVLVTKFVGWALVVICAAKLIKLAVGDRLHWGRDAFYSGACIAVGVILLARPMIIANLIGRTMGIILMVWGLTAIRDGHSKLIAILTVVAGLTLVCIPASLTNALLTICGLIMTAIAVVNILANVRARKRISGNDTPNIIDAAQ